ncbi:unnamed protein product [Symbiodinium sp. KB8]|nr:unnamed protein product [Symbiodinium sp. KB8]
MTSQTAPKPAPKPRAKLPVANTDLTVERREAVFHLPSGLADVVTSMLRDKRDLQLVEALLSILLIVPTSAALVFLAPWWQLKVVLGLLHVPFVFVVFAARFILGLHYWSHAPRGSVWTKGMPFASVLQAIPTMFIAPFFGIPAGMYYLHHVAMHHRDNNAAPWPHRAPSCAALRVLLWGASPARTANAIAGRAEGAPSQASHLLVEKLAPSLGRPDPTSRGAVLCMPRRMPELPIDARQAGGPVRWKNGPSKHLGRYGRESPPTARRRGRRLRASPRKNVMDAQADRSCGPRMAPADLSSTMPYQRNSILGFLHYWARFFFFALFELPIHSLNAGNYRLLAQGIASAAFFLAKIFLLMQVDAIATTFVFVLPFFVASLALMFGNWSQHIFVDPDAYEDGVAKDADAVNYSLTFNCMNSPENGMTFNDGYHIIHHRWASLHWADLPQKCIDDLEAHARNDALIFSDADPMAIGLAVMSGNWDWVVSRYVHYGQTPVPRTPKEIEAELKRRLAPIQCGPSKSKAL